MNRSAEITNLRRTFLYHPDTRDSLLLSTIGAHYKVTATFSHADEVLTELIIDGEWIETTPEHPFYTEENVWVTAEELKTGMHVRRANPRPERTPTP